MNPRTCKRQNEAHMRPVSLLRTSIDVYRMSVYMRRRTLCISVFQGSGRTQDRKFPGDPRPLSINYVRCVSHPAPTNGPARRGSRTSRLGPSTRTTMRAHWTHPLLPPRGFSSYRSLVVPEIYVWITSAVPVPSPECGNALSSTSPASTARQNAPNISAPCGPLGLHAGGRVT